MALQVDKQKYIKIDGSILEGGGQILRNSVALSGILSKPIQIEKIRAGRKNPGLRAQHLSGINLINSMFQGRLVGGKVGSSSITFTPSGFKEGDYVADIKTAGATMLLFQISLPCAIFAKSPIKLTLRGGTDAAMAPPVDYITNVFKPVVNLMGIDFDLDIKRRGFFPKGGGEVVVTTKSLGDGRIKPLDLSERGDLVDVEIITFICSQKNDNMTPIAENRLKDIVDCPIRKRISRDDSIGNGMGILIVGTLSSGGRIAGSSQTDKGINQEKAAENAVIEFIQGINEGGAVDHYLQDQLIIYMALANGPSRIKIGKPTLHTQTSIYFVSLMTGAKIELKEDTIICNGINKLVV